MCLFSVCLASFPSALLWRLIYRLSISETSSRHPANSDQYSVDVLKQLIPHVHSPEFIFDLCLSSETDCWAECSLFPGFHFPSWLTYWNIRCFLFIYLYLLLNALLHWKSCSNICAHLISVSTFHVSPCVFSPQCRSLFCTCEYRNCI